MSKDFDQLIKDGEVVKAAYLFAEEGYEDGSFGFTRKRLIEGLAERVQELEEEKERYQSGRNVAVATKMKMDDLEQQNKCYREALEFYALGRHWITSLKDGRDYVNEYGERARKALDGEE